MKYTLSFCEIEQLTDNIFEVIVNEGAEVDETCIEENQKFWRNLRNEPYRLLVNHKNPHSFTFRGAMEIGENSLEERTAVLVKDHKSMVQASLVLELKESGGVVDSSKIFRDRDSAIKWLKAL